MDTKFFFDIAKNYFSQFNFFADPNYYSGIVKNYMSVAGVISAGVLAFLILIILDNEDNDRAGPIKALMGLVAVETSPVLIDMIYNFFKISYTTQIANMSMLSYANEISSSTHPFYMQMNPVNNTISGFVLVLIMYSVYKFDEGYAFWTGILFYSITLLMNINAFVPNLNNRIILLMFIQYIVGSIVIGFLSMNLCNRKYFYNAWIIYMIFHFVSRVVVALSYGCFVEKLSFWKSIEEFKLFLTNNSGIIWIDIFIFGFVLMIAIIYERSVFKDIKENRVSPAPVETTTESE